MAKIDDMVPQADRGPGPLAWVYWLGKKNRYKGFHPFRLTGSSEWPVTLSHQFTNILGCRVLARDNLLENENHAQVFF